MEIGAPLIGVAAIITVLVLAWIMRKVTSGEIVPLAVREMHAASERHVALLEEQNEILRKERQYERAELISIVKAATEAQFAMREFLSRYESAGGMVMADRIHREDT